MCTYFNDRGISDGYERRIQEGLLTAEEAALLQEFHQKAKQYEPPAGDYDHEAILADPEWDIVVAAAQHAWCSIVATISDPEERTLIASLESETWKAEDVS
jgi:hypothetical protein